MSDSERNAGGIGSIPWTVFQDLEQADHIITTLLDAVWERCPGAGGTDTSEQEQEAAQTGIGGEDATERQNEARISDDESPLVGNASPLPDGQAITESELIEPEIDAEPLGRRLDCMNAASLDLLKAAWKFAGAVGLRHSLCKRLCSLISLSSDCR